MVPDAPTMIILIFGLMFKLRGGIKLDCVGVAELVVVAFYSKGWNGLNDTFMAFYWFEL
jgi:hypothetical protein